MGRILQHVLETVEISIIEIYLQKIKVDIIIATTRMAPTTAIAIIAMLGTAVSRLDSEDKRRKSPVYY